MSNTIKALVIGGSHDGMTVEIYSDQPTHRFVLRDPLPDVNTWGSEPPTTVTIRYELCRRERLAGGAFVVDVLVPEKQSIEEAMERLVRAYGWEP